MALFEIVPFLENITPRTAHTSWTHMSSISDVERSWKHVESDKVSEDGAHAKTP